MKKINWTCLLSVVVLLLSSNPVWAVINGGDTIGNGGGGVCAGVVCKTFAEAGLQIQSPSDPYTLLSPALVRELKSLMLKVSFGGYSADILKGVIGDGSNYIKLDVVDESKINLLKSTYIEVIKNSQNTQIDINNIEIFAFAAAKGEVTFLLPSFYKLSVAQQAKVLIHEYNVRAYRSSHFIEALEFDGLLQSLINNPNLFFDKSFRIDRWFEILALIYPYSDFSNKKMTMADWLNWLYKNNGVVIESVNLCQPSPLATLEYSVVCIFDTSKVLENYEITTGFLRFITDMNNVSTLDFFNKPLDDINRKILTDICQNLLVGKDHTRFYFPIQIPGQVGSELGIISCASRNGVTEVIRLSDL